MARRQHAVEGVIADQRVFPAHRVVQRVGAGIAPMPVKPVLGEGGARAGELVELIARQDGNLRGQDLRFRHLERGFGDRRLTGLGDGTVNGVACLFQHGFRGMQADDEIADGGDRVRVFPGVIDAAVDPGAGLRADEADRVLNGRAGDAKINGGLDDLRDWAIGRGL
jgi:hypothetical protein